MYVVLTSGLVHVVVSMSLTTSTLYRLKFSHIMLYSPPKTVRHGVGPFMRVSQCLWLWTSLLCFEVSYGFLPHQPNRKVHIIPLRSHRPLEDVLTVKVKIAEASDLEDMGHFFLKEEGYSPKSIAGTM